MSNISALNSNNSSFMNTYFGTTNKEQNSNTSWLSSISDLNMIKSGVYKKAMKAYYAKVSSSEDSITESIRGSGAADSTVSLSNLKSSAQKLYDSANKLKKADYSNDKKPEDLLGNVKEFVDNYNSNLTNTKKMNSYSILQTAVWGTEQMNISEGMLNKVGISIGVDNKLTIDEDKFKEAKMSDLKTLFSGSGSLADRVGQKASTMLNQSANQLALNQGQYTYNMYGTLF